MSRQHVTFTCENSELVGTLDDASGSTGLLIVSGGREIRSGAFSGQAQLAARIAAAGYPVFRFDRRGVGDSSGADNGFRSSAADVQAALAAFHAQRPKLRRIVAFGNCDAASALALQSGAGCDTLILSNPWLREDDSGTLPPAAIRSRYAQRLASAREWLRLLSGGVSLRKLASGLKASLRPSPSGQETPLMQEMQAGLAQFAGSVHWLTGGNDRTGQTFMAEWQGDLSMLATCNGADHAFSGTTAQEWLASQILGILAQEEAGELDMG
ncbi:hydrolase 1, exosortase A system-associated [Altericroceibacterium endophyticum]|uniref:Hydrolase 1, exosortase A system-associated n=1 Tax=Altericroceibacterium endophyticum TaxID=1808508 RepID=A0A6I4T5T7_9SPHN|nr:hydrolase 1, exosortase A system-associated [Altericroceibacterium endophyticum]MXO66038.1 hydrolase 1, exosortase A system-associated [Altericroceibacterium endophyticum]